MEDEDENENPHVECHRQEMIDEYVWSMDILEGSTLESKKEDYVDEHQSYIMEEPLLVFLNAKRKNPQAHGITVVAFHPEVFRVLYFPHGTGVLF